MSQLQINGVSLQYDEWGQGDPLILVHGSASDYRTWHNQQDRFATSYRLITYSRRYHWPNEPIAGRADYSMPEQVADLRALIQKLDAKPAHLVGHSYGAFLCLLVAIQEPSFVRTLVLAEPPAITLFVSSRPKPLELLKLLATRPRTAIAVIDFGARAVAPATAAAKQGNAKKAMRLFGQAILGQSFYRNLSEQRLIQVDANAITAEFLGSGFAPLDAAQVRKLKAPTLLITGQHSHPLFHHIADRLQELLPNTERTEVEGASHIMHEDNSPAFHQAVKQFLEQHRIAV